MISRFEWQKAKESVLIVPHALGTASPSSLNLNNFVFKKKKKKKKGSRVRAARAWVELEPMVCRRAIQHGYAC